MKRTVYLETTASFTVTVEIPDDTPEEKIDAIAIDAACNEAPSSVCAQCAGWGQNWGMDLGEWEATEVME